MSLVLVDTSIWVEVLRKKQPLDLEAIVSIDDVRWSERCSTLRWSYAVSLGNKA